MWFYVYEVHYALWKEDVGEAVSQQWATVWESAPYVWALSQQDWIKSRVTYNNNNNNLLFSMDRGMGYRIYIVIDHIVFIYIYS